MKEVEYYKITESLNHKYFQIPQELFYNPLYKDKLSSDSKILYSLLLDRLTLSIKNNWCDKSNNVYLIFTREEFANILGSSYKTSIKAFKELIDIKLITEKKQGMGKPNLIFVAKIQHSDMTCKIYTSRHVENASNDMSNLHTINTNTINTYNNHPINENSLSIDEVKSQCNLSDFKTKERCILDTVINILYNSSNLKINGNIVSQSEIANKLALITKNNLIHLLDVIKQNSNIKNLNSYLVSTLYNNLGNNYNKKNSKIANFKSRDYSKDFLESFYSNV